MYQENPARLIKVVAASGVFHARRLMAIAERAHAHRRFDILAGAGRALTAFTGPLSAIGRYYRGLATDRVCRGDVAGAVRLYEGAYAECPPRYKARVLLALSAVNYALGDYAPSLLGYGEALRASLADDYCDPQTVLHAGRMIAIFKSIEGDHRAALRDIEGQLPLASRLGRRQPFVYFDHLNSLAVELLEVGRARDAQSVATIVLASPYASAYPEWQETMRDVQAALPVRSRAFVSAPAGPRPHERGNYSLAAAARVLPDGVGSSSANLVDFAAARDRRIAQHEGDLAMQKDPLRLSEARHEIVETLYANPDEFALQELQAINQFLRQIIARNAEAQESGQS